MNKNCVITITKYNPYYFNLRFLFHVTKHSIRVLIIFYISLTDLISFRNIAGDYYIKANTRY